MDIERGIVPGLGRENRRENAYQQGRYTWRGSVSICTALDKGHRDSVVVIRDPGSCDWNNSWPGLIRPAGPKSTAGNE